MSALGGLLPDNSNWIACNGSEFKVSDYPDLFGIIGYLYGGDKDKGVFKVPDYRGCFLRGTSYESKIDPDKDLRTPATGSTVPNSVGSTQPWATKIPDAKTPFTASVPNLPQGTVSCDGGA